MKIYIVMKLDYDECEVDRVYFLREWALRRQEKLLNLLTWNDKLGMFSGDWHLPYDYRWVSILEKEVV